MPLRGGAVVKNQSMGNDVFRYKYTAQEDDTGTELFYYKARFYDAGVGRFLSADTIVPSSIRTQAFNRYMYVEGNPVNNNDPDGHDGGLIIGICIAIVATYYGHKEYQRQKQERRSSGEIYSSGKFWGEVGKGAFIGFTIGLAIVSGNPVPLLNGGINAYYAHKEGRSSNDIFAAYAIGWGVAQGCNEFAIYDAVDLVTVYTFRSVMTEFLTETYYKEKYDEDYSAKKLEKSYVIGGLSGVLSASLGSLGGELLGEGGKAIGENIATLIKAGIFIGVERKGLVELYNDHIDPKVHLLIDIIKATIPKRDINFSTSLTLDLKWSR